MRPGSALHAVSRRRHGRRQRGAVFIMGVLWLSVALACVLVLDVGHLFWQQRELQKAADFAALAGASGQLHTDCRFAPQALATQSLADNGYVRGSDVAPDIQPGHWKPEGADPAQFFRTGGPASSNACRVILQHTVPYFFVWRAMAGGSRTLTAQAVALQGSRLARLAIRSTVATVNSDQSAILNPLFKLLLGGSVNVSLVGWQGIAGLNLNVLQFLDALALKVGVQAGQYQQLLATDIKVGDIVDVWAQVLKQNAALATTTIHALDQIRLGAAVSNVKIRLQPLVQLQTGAPAQALNFQLNALEMLMATLQIANSQSALQTGVKIALPGSTAIDVALKVIEPPQFTVIGDPELAKAEPLGPNRLFVRTAQLRLLLSINLGGGVSLVDGLVGLLDFVLDTTLSVALGLVGSAGVPVGQVFLVDAVIRGLRVDIGVDVGGGTAYLTDYNCEASPRTVTAPVTTTLATVRMGQWGSSLAQAQSNAFATNADNQVQPLKLLLFNCQHCDGAFKITPQYFGGVGVGLNLKVGSSTTLSKVIAAQSFDEAMQWQQAAQVGKVLDGLGNTVGSQNLVSMLPAHPDAKPTLLTALLSRVTGLLSDILELVQMLLQKVLSPLLDPVLDGLLKALGIQVGPVDVGAQLSCGQGAELVN